MDAIETKIDTTSVEYRKNYDAMEALLEDLKNELKKARDDRSPKAVERLLSQGKLPMRKKLELLLDKNTPFLEIAPMAAKDMYDGKIHGAGLVSGIGIVSGKEVMVSGNDAMIKGGATYPLTVKKTLRTQLISMENRLPLVTLIDSAGGYLQLQSEVFPDVDDGGRIFYNQAIMSKMGIPQITAVMGLCTAGGAYVPAMSDETIHVKGTGAIFLGGPPLVKAATGEEVSVDELGGADLHCRESGVSDYYADDDAHAISIIRSIIKNLPQGEKTRLSMQEPAPPLYDTKEIYGIVSSKFPTMLEKLLHELLIEVNFWSSRSSSVPHWCAGGLIYMATRSAFSATTEYCFPTVHSRGHSSYSFATKGRSLLFFCRISTDLLSAGSMNARALPKTATKWLWQSPPQRSRNSQ
jgi:acetyl-CoA carboxylase carboxyltransferase component